MSADNQCRAQVRAPGMGFGHFHPCRRSGVLLEAGRYWCKQHAPSTVKKRKDAWTQKIDAQHRRQKHGWAVQEAAAEVVEISVAHYRGKKTLLDLAEAIRKYLKLKEKA